MDVTQERADLIGRLVGLPDHIDAAERAVLHRATQVEAAENRLRDTEAALLLTPDRIVGKNAEVRAAELRAATATERIAVADARDGYEAVRAVLATLQAQLSCDQALSRLVALAS